MSLDIQNSSSDFPFEVVQLAGCIGAEIRGISLSGELDPKAITALRKALVRYKVIFFRDQALDDARHEAFAALMGNPVAHPTLPASQGAGYLIDVTEREGVAASVWHTDVTFIPTIPEMSILRAITIPKVGGDTMWANCATAYEGLPDNFKAFVNGLWAIHSNTLDYASAHPEASKEQVASSRSSYSSTTYETMHPVVRVHPESGERVLLAGTSIKRLVGFNRTDSQRILDILQDHIAKAENTVRWHWHEGDVAIWDNRATQHRVVADFGSQPRAMRRATTAGPVPVAIDGQLSSAIAQ